MDLNFERLGVDYEKTFENRQVMNRMDKKVPTGLK